MMAVKKINLDKLIDSYLEISSSSPLDLDEALKEYGYDPKEFEDRNLKKIKQLLYQNQVASKKEKALDFYSKAVNMVKTAALESKQAIFLVLQKKSPSFQFRSLEKLDEENLRQILNETEILEMIEKLEKGELT